MNLVNRETAGQAHPFRRVRGVAQSGKDEAEPQIRYLYADVFRTCPQSSMFSLLAGSVFGTFANRRGKTQSVAAPPLV